MRKNPIKTDVFENKIKISLNLADTKETAKFVFVQILWLRC